MLRLHSYGRRHLVFYKRKRVQPRRTKWLLFDKKRLIIFLETSCTALQYSAIIIAGYTIKNEKDDCSAGHANRKPTRRCHPIEFDAILYNTLEKY